MSNVVRWLAPDLLAPPEPALDQEDAFELTEPDPEHEPEPPLHRESVIRTGAQRPLVIGDRLDTDIEGANRAGVPSLLVLTGVARPADVVRAGPVHRPTYVAADLHAGLLEPHPPVTRDARGWTCGAATITPDGALSGGTDTDGVRAACVAAWSGELTPAAFERLAAAVPKP